MSALPQFEKINGDNFRMWKLQISAYLNVHKLIKIVNGQEERPVLKDDKSNLSEVEAWDVKDAQAQRALLTAIGQCQIDFVSAAS